MNFKRILPVVVLIFLLSITGFIIWASTPLGPSDGAMDALFSTDQVSVETDTFLTFTPKNIDPQVGLIFYPGGRVAEESYAPLAQMIASNGYLVVIVPMPLHLAVFAPSKAQQVINTYDSIKIWSIAGHSLGGSMAAAFVHDNPNEIAALYLLASYTTESADLSSPSYSSLTVLSIYGSSDTVLSADMNETMSLLPETARLIKIDGGNHANFGSYGPQPGDGKASIERIDQQKITTHYISSSLASLVESHLSVS